MLWGVDLMRVPAYFITKLNLIRAKAPQSLWPDLDDIIQWSENISYKWEYRPRKRQLSYDDYIASDEGDGHWRVTDVNGKVTFPADARSKYEAITLVMEAKKVEEQLKRKKKSETFR
jgi:hypothetical protein